MALTILLTSVIAVPFAGAEDTLTLKKARELTLSRSATLRKAELSVDAASLSAQAQGYSALPTLTASASGTYNYGQNISDGSVLQQEDPLSTSVEISASETVFDGGKIAALVKKYGLATESERETLRSTRVSLIGNADSAFFAVLEAQASVEAASSDLDAAKLLLQIAQAKIDAGTISKSDYLQTEANTAGYETTLITSKKTLASARAKLASLTGLPAATALEQIDFSSYDGLLAKLGALDEAAIDKLTAEVTILAKANSPTLRVNSLAKDQAKLAIAIAKKSYLPTVAAGLSETLSYGSDSGLSPTGSISLTASMSLDLWNTKNSVDSASVAAAQADMDESQGKTDLDLDLVQALYEWLSSAGSVRSSAKALAYAESNYQNVLEKFKLSSATASDLSTAEATLTSDKTALITARYGFLSDLSTLRGLAGLESEDRILSLIP
jgi:outer membrane protein